MKRLLYFWRSRSKAERKLIKTAGSVVVNGMTGIYKIFLGMYYLSDWLLVNGIYYIILSIAKTGILRRYHKISRIPDKQLRKKEGIKIFGKTGSFLGMIGVSYFGVSLHSLLTGDSVFYPDYVRYVMVLIAFGKIFFGIYGICQTARIKSPVILAVRMIDVTDAVVSLVACRCVLQVMKGAAFAVESSSILGIACSILFILAGWWMHTKGTVKNKGEHL